MLKLYQFPISHYCEKIRWALDYKGIEYATINLIPGLHIRHTQNMGLRSSVPLIQHKEKHIQGSIDIIDYLDQAFPHKQLTPVSEAIEATAMEWEFHLGNEVGVHVRRCIYHILLDYPGIVKPLFSNNGPWYGRVYLLLAYPKLAKAMRKFMHINADTAAESQRLLAIAIEKLAKHYQHNEFLAGEEFSRADLTAAALCAPLTMEKQYGLNWPSRPPDKLTLLMEEFSSQLSWVSRIYSEYR